MNDSPVAVLYNSDFAELSVTASQAITSAQPGLVMMGSGSSGWEFFRLAPNGELFVTGSVSIDTTAVLQVSVSNQPTVNQGTAGSQAEGWFVRISDGTQTLGTGSSAPIWVTGSVQATIVSPITQSVKLDQWSSNVTGSVGISSWLTGVTASVNQVGSATSTVSGTVANTVAVTILSANANRKGAIFYLDGKDSAYIKLGTGASLASFSTRLIANGSMYELPFWYTGPVSVIFAAVGTTTLYTTEISL